MTSQNFLIEEAKVDKARAEARKLENSKGQIAPHTSTTPLNIARVPNTNYYSKWIESTYSKILGQDPHRQTALMASLDEVYNSSPRLEDLRQKGPFPR